MGYTAKELIAIAQAEVGYLEKASNKNLDDKTANAGYANYTKYARDLNNAGYYNGNKNGYAWCDVFVDWCFLQLCNGDSKEAEDMICQTGDYGAGCGYSAGYYKNQGRFYTTNPEVGDQIFFWNSSKNAVAHTGLIKAIDNKYIYTIEGNTSSTAGVVANGGGVFEKKYSINYTRIYGYGRPKYTSEAVPAPTPSNNKPIIDVDGIWGRETTRRLQQIFKTPIDGEVSNQHKAYKSSNPGLSAGWEWKSNPSGGSNLIRALQSWVGATADGLWGPNTCRAMQRKLGTPVDGKVSKPSVMVKALQKWANEQD